MTTTPSPGVGAAPEEPTGLREMLQERGFVRSSRVGAVAWDGNWKGRTVKLTFSRMSRTRYSGEVRRRQHLGFRLRVDTPTSVGARLFFVREGFANSPITRFIYRLRRQEVITDVPAALAGYTVVTTDARWGRVVLSEGEVCSQVSYLLRQDASKALGGSVHLSPGEMHFASPTLQRDQIDVAWVSTALDRVVWIADALERLPAPTRRETLSRWEQFAKRQPLLSGALILFGCFGAIGVAMMVLLGLVWLVAG